MISGCNCILGYIKVIIRGDFHIIEVSDVVVFDNSNDFMGVERQRDDD